jgi:hypothetical protein
MEFTPNFYSEQEVDTSLTNTKEKSGDYIGREHDESFDFPFAMPVMNIM